MKIKYQKKFDPPLVEGRDDNATAGGGRYRYSEQAVLVINAALVTGRPILVRGLSGTGKSSMARDAARELGRRPESQVISGSTTAEDLKWQIDHVKRLALAHGQGTAEELDLANFVSPGVLWWSFDPAAAMVQHRRVYGVDRPGADIAQEAVLLLDEIDKADPDLANALLEPMEEGTFTVPYLNDRVVARRQDLDEASPLIFVTTNEERRLPDAFLRRCLELVLKYPDRKAMQAIATEHGVHAHFGEIWDALFGQEIDRVPISTAELLDTLRAFEELRMGDPEEDSRLLEKLATVTAWKHGHEPPPRRS